MKRAFFTRLLPSVALFTAIFTLRPLQAADLSGEEVYKKGLKSTTWIVVPDGEGNLHMGSGSLIDVKQKLVLTNHHVIMSMKDTVLVQFPMWDGRGRLISEKKAYFDSIKSNGAIPAKVLFSEKTKDLAILQLARLPKGVEAVRFAEDTPGSAADVHSVGNPGASDALFVYSPGKVRTSYVKKWTAGGGSILLNIEAKIIESTSPTSAGDSGGPLFNSKGEQVGVTQGGLVDPKASGYSYFIDVSEVKTMLRNHRVALTPQPQVQITSNNDEGSSKSEPTTPVAEPRTEPTVKAETKKTETKVEDTGAADEKAAENRLGLIKTLIDQGKPEVASRRLNELIKSYPSTQAAKEAKELLKKLK